MSYTFWQTSPRLSDVAWRDFDAQMAQWFGANATPTSEKPQYAVHEGDLHYELALEVPGVAQDAIQVEVKDGLLRVTGVAQTGTSAKPQSRRYEASFQLPTDVDSSKVEAIHENGILRLALPKHEKTRPRVIAVRGAEAKDGFFGKLFAAKQAETKAATEE